MLVALSILKIYNQNVFSFSREPLPEVGGRQREHGRPRFEGFRVFVRTASDLAQDFRAL